MNLKNNKGFTGVDISVALIVIVLFVSIIATLIYNFGVTSKAVNRKAQATNIAISKIEEMKQISYDQLKDSVEYKDADGKTVANGPYTVTTTITNYKDSKYVQTQEKNNLEDVIKIVTVNVEYNTGTNTESVDISTVITKES